MNDSQPATGTTCITANNASENRDHTSDIQWHHTSVSHRHHTSDSHWYYTSGNQAIHELLPGTIRVTARHHMNDSHWRHNSDSNRHYTSDSHAMHYMSDS